MLIYGSFVLLHELLIFSFENPLLYHVHIHQPEISYYLYTLPKVGTLTITYVDPTHLL